MLASTGVPEPGMASEGSMARARISVCLVAAAWLASGCGNGSRSDGGADLSAVSGDLGAPRDLSASGDLSCVHQTFAGFAGTTANERRLDCTCGCDVDTFESGVVSGFWNVAAGESGVVPLVGVGLELEVASDGGTALSALNSESPLGPFYLDGDFDLLVDWRLAAPPPPGAHLTLNLSDQSGTVNGSYSLERERTTAGNGDFTAQLGGIAPVQIATTAESGTLELARSGFAVRALADGNLISQFTGASKGRLTVAFSAAVQGCVSDGGACQLTVVWHRMRMTGGALVDRR